MKSETALFVESPQGFDPGQYIEEIRGLVRSGRVSRAQTMTPEARQRSTDRAEEATEYLTQLAGLPSDQDDQLTSTLYRSFSQEVANFSVVTERAAKDRLIPLPLSDFSFQERQELYKQILADYLSVLGTLAGDKHCLTRHVIEHSPVLIHSPEYIESLAAEYPRLSGGYFRRTVANAPLSPKSALEKLYQAKGWNNSAECAEGKPVDTLSALAEVRDLLKNRKILLTGNPAAESITLTMSVKERAEKWLARLSPRPQPLRSNLGQRMLLDHVGLLFHATDRAWRQGLSSISPEALAANSDDEMFGILADQYVHICRILTGGRRRFSENTLQHRLALYHSPEEVESMFNRQPDYGRSDRAYVFAFNPIDPEQAFERVRHALRQARDQYPDTREETIKRATLRSPSRYYNRLERELGNEDFEDTGLLIDSFPDFCARLKESDPSRGATFHDQVVLTGDRILDYLWSHTVADGVAHEVQLAQYSEWYMQTIGEKPIKLPFVLDQMAGAGIIQLSHKKNGNEQRFRLTPEGLRLLQEAMHGQPVILSE